MYRNKKEFREKGGNRRNDSTLHEAIHPAAVCVLFLVEQQNDNSQPSIRGDLPTKTVKPLCHTSTEHINLSTFMCQPDASSDPSAVSHGQVSTY